MDFLPYIPVLLLFFAILISPLTEF